MRSGKTAFILTDLISKIYQKQFSDNKLPTQRDLASSYHVSRFTVQKVMKQLQNIGLVTAIQGDGIYIRDKALDNPMVYNSLTEVSYRELSSRMLFLNEIVAGTELGSIFNLSPDDKIWQFQRIRIVNYEISQIETSYMPVKLFPDLNREAIEDSIQNYVLKKGFKISHYMTAYHPTLLSKQESELLNCKKNTPAMSITSRGILKDGTIYIYSNISAIHYECTYVIPFNKEVYKGRRK